MELWTINFKVALWTLSFIIVNSQAQSPTLIDIARKENAISAQVGENIGQSAVINNAGIQEDLMHECVRPCLPNTLPKKCSYHFRVEWYVSMSKACFDCPFNVTDCLRPHCVPADGFPRTLITVNRRLPGPFIQVCQGDEIIVDVENGLMSDSTTVHWHGLHQRGTPYMDGVPLLTQCPIPPETTFRYHFIADNYGTHYWHSHSGLQRDDGMFGAFIVRSKSDNARRLYDVDDPSHVFIINDWMKEIVTDNFVTHHFIKSDNKPYNLLVNGMGTYKPVKKDGAKAFTPVYEISVKQGQRYRIRVIGNSDHNCPIQVSVDNHNMIVIASDGYDIDPIEAQSVTLVSGERWDFVIQTNQPVGAYWIKFNGQYGCDHRYKGAYQVAVLRYEGAIGYPSDINNINYNSTHRIGLELNRITDAPGDFINFMTSADIRTSDRGHSESYLRTPDLKFWFDFDFYSKNSQLIDYKGDYPFYGVEGKELYLPQINSISMKFPHSPVLSQADDINENEFCNAASNNYTDCKKEYCHCVHAINIPLGSLVEIILIDLGSVQWSNHPFHMHGNKFAVMGMEKLGKETTVEEVQLLDKNGQLQRNFIKPPLKDTVTVPDAGYTVIRYIADNPGYWIFHCHTSFHGQTGMAVVFKVGERSNIPPVPIGFPKCNSYLPTPQDNLREFVDSWSI